MEAHHPPVHVYTSLPAPNAARAQAAASQATQLPKPPVFSKMEALVREMQDLETGIPIRSQKLFLTTIPSAFMGYELVEWLMERLDVEDSTEAIHLANLLCQFGYFFPVGEARSLIVKEDSSLYRFQSPYYWPSQNHIADTTDYAIYLTKRLFRNKQKHGLEDYELETYAKLKKGLQHKWDFVTMQAEEQMRLSKERKKGDKIVTDSQERAYWRVYRPPQGFTNCLEVAPVPDKTNMANRVRKKTVELIQQELEWLRPGLDRTRSKVSVASETLISNFEVFQDYDPFLVTPHPSNPWISDEEEFWLLNDDYADVPTERRVKRWAISFQELISDPLGMAEFTSYLRKEYSHENIRFWQAVNELRYGPASSMNEAVDNIYEEFLKPGAPCEINIDGKTMEETQQQRKQPSRYTYDLASEHVYALLLKKDCYPRFLRSEDYKGLLATAVQPSAKKPRFFHLKSGPGRKKTSTSASASNSLALVAVTPQPLKRHGSDEHQQQRVDAGGVHLGGTPTPPLSSHRLDCEPPYRGDLPTQRILTQSKDVSSTYAIGEDSNQSSVCPWETAEVSNICPWENTEPSSSSAARTPTSQPSSLLLQQQKSFRVESSTTHLKGKPPDRSVSVDVCSIGQNRGNFMGTAAQVSPTSGSHLAASTSDPKVTLNICPWESQDLPQKQQEKSRSVDVEVCPWDQSDDSGKEPSEPSHPVGREQSGNKSPSSITTIDSRGEATYEVSAKPKEIEKPPSTSPSRSLQNLQQLSMTQSFADTTAKQQTYRLSTDLSNVKINVDQSGDNSSRKSSHRELSASASVPCTSILGHEPNLDYTVRSGHTTDQFELKPVEIIPQVATTPVSGCYNISGVTSSTTTTAEETHAQGTQISDDRSQYPRSVPSTPQIRKTQIPRTVSVSSQTQTDPIVQQKTNQQTQYPSRDSSFRHSSRHSHRQSKHVPVHYAVDYPPTSRSQAQQMSMIQALNRSQQLQIQFGSLRFDSEYEKLSHDKQHHLQQDAPVQRKHSEPNQSKYSQHRQQQYYHSKEDYEDHQRMQQQIRSHQQVSLGNQREEGQKSIESRMNQQRFDETMNQRRNEQLRDFEMENQDQQRALEEQTRLRERHEQRQLIRQHEIQLHFEPPSTQAYLQSPLQERPLVLQHFGDTRREEHPLQRERIIEFTEEESQRSVLRSQIHCYESQRTSQLEPYSSIPSFPVVSQETLTSNLPHIVQTLSAHIQPQMSSSQVHHHQICPISYSGVYVSSTLQSHDTAREPRPSMTVVSTSQSLSPAPSRRTVESAACRESSVLSYSKTAHSSKLAGASGQIEIETSTGLIQIATSVCQKFPSRSSEEPPALHPSSPKSSAPPSKVWNDPADICPWEDEERCRVDAPFVKTYATLGYL